MPRHLARRVTLALAALALCLGLTGIAQTPQSVAAGPEVTFRLIVVSTPERAEQIAARVRRGEDFAALAKAESLDASASRGGLVGPVALSSLLEAVQAALRAAPAGGIGGIVRMPTGYALVQRLDATEAAGPAAAGARGAEIFALTGAGDVKATISVDGLVEVQTALAGVAKPPDWNLDPQAICTTKSGAIDLVKQVFARDLASAALRARADLNAFDIVEAHVSLAQLHAYTGDMALSVAEYEKAYQLALDSSPASLQDLDQALGAAYIHKAEMANDIYTRPGDRCLLSTRVSPPLASTGDFSRGERHLLALLDKNPDDLEIKWLLNAAHMATGGYPDRVPARHLIPVASFASAEDVGRFTDVAEAAGVNSFSLAGGVVVDDFDNDGRFDIMTSSSNSCAPLQFFRRGDDGRFVDRAAAAGLGRQLGGLNLSHVDYDNNGCLDLLVMRGGWDLAQRRSLLRNNCDGTFTDVTAAAGLLTPVSSSQTATWADIDNDGWVDLFVGNEDLPTQLFHNRRDGTFVDIAAAAGVQRTAFTKGVASGDFDNDGFTDLYVSNFSGANHLYRNNGDRTFTDVSAAAGVRGADRGFPAWFFDYDNDGWEDLFAGSYFLSLEETARSYLGLPLKATPMKLYRNAGNGRFADVTVDAGLGKALMPMGANFGDIDNDGFLDIYLGTGSPSYVSLAPSMLLRNRAGRSFADVTVSSGTGEMHKGHGVAFADLDGDGDDEIVFKVGGAAIGDAHAFRLFENPGHRNDWLGVKLVGVRTNRAAIGARIKVTVEDAGGARRAITRTVNSGGSFGASPFEQHIGLGQGARVVDVEVRWPASGTRQTFDGVAKNQVIQIREGAAAYTKVTRTPLPLGGRRAR
ncbi:MAG TPA: FG-GAP-like repeat-containing protein [Vicinamibacterales bacterium]|nr:FG-GAP-like repeat-containing protein [Vicinamibacterales bacterium]